MYQSQHKVSALQCRDKNVPENLGYTVGEIIHDMIIVCKVIFKKRKRIDAIKRGNKRSG